MGKENIDPKQ